MKQVKFLIIGLLLFTGWSGCTKSFLDVGENREVYRQSYVRDLVTMQHFMNGVYIELSWNFEQGYKTAYADLVADNLRQPSATASNLMIPHYSWSQYPDQERNSQIGASTQNMNAVWKTGYLIIRSCNFVIEDIGRYENENPALAANIKGQAYAMRAYVHSVLVNIFAQCYKYTTDASHPGIPYITVSDVTVPFTRQTVAEVYTNIIADYNNAIGLLPATTTDIRFLNMSAVKALLARTLLFKEDFTEAKALAVEIAAQHPLMTIAAGYPNDVFKFKPNPAQTEVLFQLSPQTATYGTIFLGYFLRATPIRFVATADIAGLLREQSGDTRRNWVTLATGGIWNVTKYPVGSAPEVTPAVNPTETAYSPAIIRSSEIFLTAAEASAKLNDPTTANIYLNAVRQRANTSLGAIAPAGSALLDSIYKERRKELAFEGFRMFDIQRWKQDVNRGADALFPTAKILPFPSNKAIAPIPEAETVLAGIPQNQGY